MDEATQNSKLVHEQQKHTTPYHAYPYPSITFFNQSPNINPMFSTMNNKFNEVKDDASSSSWYFVEESESDSCSGAVGGDDEEEEVMMSSLEYEMLYKEGETKRKIEQLAAMVGVDPADPAVVLSEVVTLLNHLNNTINLK